MFKKSKVLYSINSLNDSGQAKSIYIVFKLLHKHTDKYKYRILHYAHRTGDCVYCLGHVKGLGYDGKLIVKGKFAPRISLKVIDNSKRVVGTVARVFGPVKSPYISIKPLKNQKPSLEMVGKELYVRDRTK